MAFQLKCETSEQEHSGAGVGCVLMLMDCCKCYQSNIKWNVGQKDDGLYATSSHLQTSQAEQTSLDH